MKRNLIFEALQVSHMAQKSNPHTFSLSQLHPIITPLCSVEGKCYIVQHYNN